LLRGAFTPLNPVWAGAHDFDLDAARSGGILRQ